MSEDSFLWIVVESDKGLFSKKSEIYFIGANHFKYDDLDVINLIGAEKNSLVKFKDKSYRINEIIPKKAKAINFCLEEYTTKKPNSPFITKIQIDEVSIKIDSSLSS